MIPTFNRQRINDGVDTLEIQRRAISAKAHADDRKVTDKERQEYEAYGDAITRLSRRYACIQANPKLESA